VLAAVLASALLTGMAYAETSKASNWIGRVVVTVDGELLGRIEDLALDVEQQSVKFVVVSIGSFLVDNNLIAVHPDALGPSEDGRYLVVYSDDLDGAQRFGVSSWPVAPDVLASAGRAPVAVDEDVAGAQEDGVDARGDRVATISDGRRTATIKPGDRNSQIESTSSTRAQAANGEVQPKRYQDGSAPLLADSEFQRLDENGDGFLSRSEIGSRLQSHVRYQDYDLDGNDGIDSFEFQLLK